MCGNHNTANDAVVGVICGYLCDQMRLKIIKPHIIFFSIFVPETAKRRQQRPHKRWQMFCRILT